MSAHEILILVMCGALVRAMIAFGQAAACICFYSRALFDRQTAVAGRLTGVMLIEMLDAKKHDYSYWQRSKNKCHV